MLQVNELDLTDLDSDSKTGYRYFMVHLSTARVKRFRHENKPVHAKKKKKSASKIHSHHFSDLAGCKMRPVIKAER